MRLPFARQKGAHKLFDSAMSRIGPAGSNNRAAAALALIGAGIALVLAAGCSGKNEPAAARSGQGQPVPVLAAPVVETTAAVEFRTFGTCEANLTAAIKSQITGVLTSVAFDGKEGQNVKKGATLFTIDQRPFEAALRQAEANLSRDTAQYDNAEKEAARQQQLLKQGIAAQGDYDQAKATADALAAAQRADQAAIEQARINLSYCTIPAPFDGRTGAWLVDLGNLVKANDVTVVVINQVQPIQVSFAVPQRQLAEIQKQMATGTLPVRASVPGQAGPPEVGKLTFIDNTVDQSTGTVRLKATFGNPGERLWPGLFVNVTLVLTEEPHALVIPSRAIQTGQQGTYVFVVKADSTAEVRPITVERPLDGDSVISKGLVAGEQVVTDGQLLLKPGSTVKVKPSLTGNEAPAKGAAPAKSEAPKP